MFASRLLWCLCGLTGAAFVIAMSLGGAAYAQEVKANDEVVLALPFPVVPYLIPIAGRDLGIFEKHGIDLDVQYIQPGPLEPAIYSGSVQFAMLPGPVPHEMAVAGTGVTVILTYSKRHQVKLMATPDISSMADLKGKVVSIANAGSSQSGMLMLSALKDAGFDPNTDVQPRAIASQADNMNALLSGQISAAMLGLPFSEIAADQGIVTLVDYTAMEEEPWPTSNLITLEDYAEQNSELVTRFVSALLESLDAWMENPEKAKEVIAREAKMENPSLVSRMYEISTELLVTGAKAAPTAREHAAVLEYLQQKAEEDPSARSPEGWAAEDFFNAKFATAALHQ